MDAGVPRRVARKGGPGLRHASVASVVSAARRPPWALDGRPERGGRLGREGNYGVGDAFGDAVGSGVGHGCGSPPGSGKSAAATAWIAATSGTSDDP